MNTFMITIQRKVTPDTQKSDDYYWPVVAEHSQQGEPLRHAEGKFILTKDDERELAKQWEPMGYGTYLGQRLFKDKIGKAFATALGGSQNSIRVLLYIEAEDNELKFLRWERLCAPIDNDWDFLVRDLGMPAVVAMTEKVTVETALALNTKFYQQMRDHGEVDRALVEAMAGLRRREDILIPALFSRLGDQSLFSKDLDRKLTPMEIKAGLERFRKLLEVSAPVLIKEFNKQATILENTLQVEESKLSKESREERQKALDKVYTLSNEVLDFPFNALALNMKIPEYNPYCPFQGLSYFSYDDREFFFGREKLIEKLKRRLTESEFLAVLGNSGSGKSSLVLAGLIPALRNNEPDTHTEIPSDRSPSTQLRTSLSQIQVAYMTPNYNPLEQLQTSLAAVPGDPAMLIVDQFEELFTLCQDEQVRQAFIERLLTLVHQQQSVIITMRADFWGACAPYNKLKELMQHGQELIAPMDSTELQIAYHRDGEGIATVNGYEEKSLYLWKPDGTFPPTLLGRGIESVAFSKDGKMMAIGRGNGFLLRQLDSNKVREVHSNIVNSIAFSDDGRMIVTGEAIPGKSENTPTGIVKLWKSDGTFLQNLPGLGGLIMSVAFSPDSQLIVAGGWLGTWGLWKSDGTVVKVTSGSLNTVDFSPDSKMFITAITDGQAILWNREGEELYKLWDTKLNQQQAHTDAIWGVRFSPDGQVIATASNDRTVKLWKSDGMLQATLEGHQNVVRAVDFSPNGQILASASDDGTVKLWRLGATALKILAGHDDVVYTVRFRPDGQTIATTSGHGWVRYWKPDGTLLQAPQQIHYGPISTLEFSSNGMMATASGDRIVKLWRADGTLLTELKGHEGEVLSISFNPQGDRVATGGKDGTIKLWQTDGSFIKDLGEHDGMVLGLSFSPDGDLLASASNDGTVKVWDMNDPFVQTFPSDAVPLVGVAFSPDSILDDQIIAAAGADGKVRLWKRDGTQLPSLEGHSTIVRAVCFSPNGQSIATASYDKTIKIWTRDGTLQRTLYGHNDHINAIAFSPDGKTLASASSDTMAILWNLDQALDLDDLISYGCDWVRDYLENNPSVNEDDRNLVLQGVWTGVV